MTDTLKPCPFCGGVAKIGKGEIEFWAYCPHCGAQTELYETEQEAIKAWNSRPIEDELDKKNGCLIGTCHDLHDIVEEFRVECDQKDFEIKRLREALEEIKKTVENTQDTIYPFHLALDSKDGIYILEVTKEALKGDDE